jgi:hypothetical protein
MTIVKPKACEIGSRGRSCPHTESRRRKTSGAAIGQAWAAIIMTVITVTILVAWAKVVGRFT